VLRRAAIAPGSNVESLRLGAFADGPIGFLFLWLLGFVEACYLLPFISLRLDLCLFATISCSE